MICIKSTEIDGTIIKKSEFSLASRAAPFSCIGAGRWRLVGEPVGRKIEICSVIQLSGKCDAALLALASPSLCRFGDPALSGAARKGLAGLSTDVGAIG
jgi:hypothetical protein